MPLSCRYSDIHLNYLATLARDDATLADEFLFKDTEHNSSKWLKRWIVLYQNILFVYENSCCNKPVTMIVLEHFNVDLISLTKLRDLSNQFTMVIAIPEDDDLPKYYLRASSQDQCDPWLKALRSASYSSIELARKELDAKYNVTTQILEAEQSAKQQLMKQCEEYNEQIQCLQAQLAQSIRQDSEKQKQNEEFECDDIIKIKKVQSFVRAWLCRRRWHAIVRDYIESGHASSMRERNQVIFHFVQDEEEYVKDLSTLVSSFLRPFRMAASARKPPTTHEEVNSIFLNCEIILFLHQIFLKGLHTRMEDWPTLVLGDLFRILLPMYAIYQEYVRNHHFSLQMLAECKKHSQDFNRLLAIHEMKTICCNRSLETFLTLPMHRVPRCIITLHKLLAFTPPDHVDRKSLEHACVVLEELSLMMQEEVSETENIRKNLSIERQIVGGCEELLDVQQVFIRQGSLIFIQEQPKKAILSFAGLGILPHERKECLRHCFLFSGLLLIATRSSNGKLHLHKSTGKVLLTHVSVIDHYYDEDITTSKADQTCEYADMALRVVVHPRNGEQPLTITLVAQTVQEKESWLSDLKQCIENISFIDNIQDTTAIPPRHFFANVRNDPCLYKDDVGIKYSKCLNSCRIPRIRYASLKRLFERLLDLRFLSIEFLNTFLITYRIFTDAHTILDVLESFYNERQRSCSLPLANSDLNSIATNRRAYSINEKHTTNSFFPMQDCVALLHEQTIDDDEETPSRPTTLQIPSSCFYRRHSSPSALGESHVFQFSRSVDSSMSCSSATTDSEIENIVESVRTCGHPDRKNFDESQVEGNLNVKSGGGDDVTKREGFIVMTNNYVYDEEVEIKGKLNSEIQDESIPVITMTSSEATKTTNNDVNSYKYHNKEGITLIEIKQSCIPESKDGIIHEEDCVNDRVHHSCVDETSGKNKQKKSKMTKHQKSSRDPQHCGFSLGLERSKELPEKRPNSCPKTVGKHKPEYLPTIPQENPSPKHSKTRSQSLLERRKGDKNGLINSTELKPKRKFSFTRPSSPRLGPSSPKPLASPGAVVTSSRPSKRKTSIAAAAAAFAAATAGAPCSPSTSPLATSHARFTFRNVQGPLARILTILHQWIIKHGQDFHDAPGLLSSLKNFIEDIKDCTRTTSEQRRFCNTILQTLEHNPKRATEEKLFERIFLQQCRPEMELNFEKLSSNQLAEQLTLTEHLLFARIPSSEFLNLSWMKSDKEVRAPNILRVSQRFNEVSRLVASEILTRSTTSSRAAVIEKWVVVADVCRHLCNYNAVLEITSALMSSSVFRLKKTWEKLSKQTRATIDKLQSLVSTDGRFKNMREALRCSNPPCIPYLGFYLTDLAFIEEGTSMKNENGLINFSKMRMIAQVVEEIRHYQEIRYNIQHDSRVTDYLFNQDILMDENSLYKSSLTWEPKKRPSVRLTKRDSQD